MEVDSNVWEGILAGCRMHWNVDAAEVAEHWYHSGVQQISETLKIENSSERGPALVAVIIPAKTPIPFHARHISRSVTSISSAPSDTNLTLSAGAGPNHYFTTAAKWEYDAGV